MTNLGWGLGPIQVQRVAAWIVCIPCGSEGPPDFLPGSGWTRIRCWCPISGETHGNFSGKSSNKTTGLQGKYGKSNRCNGRRNLEIAYSMRWSGSWTKTHIWNSDRLVKKNGISNYWSCLNLKGDSLESYFKSNPTVEPNPLLKSHLLVSGDMHHSGDIQKGMESWRT